MWVWAGEQTWSVCAADGMPGGEKGTTHGAPWWRLQCKYSAVTLSSS